jgi:hypothetical protein
LTWPATFAARLDSWNQLRNHCQTLPAQSALETIVEWWTQAPWRPYYLHWDDHPTWPDPWQLLNENIYCELATGLGILYTITLLDRKDLAPASLILTADDVNLVLVGKEKYIVNWTSDTVVNTSQAVKIKRQYQADQIL